MNLFEVRFNEGQWWLTGIGAAVVRHLEPTRDRIEAYVEGFMSLRSGLVRFYRPDGSMERESYYESHDLEMWGMSGRRSA